MVCDGKKRQKPLLLELAHDLRGTVSRTDDAKEGSSNGGSKFQLLYSYPTILLPLQVRNLHVDSRFSTMSSPTQHGSIGNFMYSFGCCSNMTRELHVP